MGKLRVVQIVAVSVACILGSSCVADDFDAILGMYREYALPEPDPAAVLISYSGKRSGRPSRVLGFADLATRSGLFGVRRETVDLSNATVIQPDEPVDFADYLLVASNDLPLAIQLYARGHKTLAKRLWVYLLARSSQTDWSIKGIKPIKFSGSTESIVATIAFATYRKQLYEKEMPWRDVAKQMVKINVDTGFGVYGQSIIDSLKASLETSAARPNTVESLIDQLLERDESDKVLRRLASLGFAAIPALIEHADDIRWTPAKRMVLMLGGGDNTLLVRDHVMYLLKGFVAPGKEQAYQHNPNGGTHLRVFVDGSGRFQKQQALAWYRDIVAQGEEDYLMRHVFPNNWIDPNPVVLQAIISKYPRRFADIYTEMLLERPQFAGEHVATIIDNSTLSDDVRVQLFTIALKYPNAGHRVAALKRLAKLDKPRFRLGLHDSLANMSATIVPKHRGWIDETEYVSMVRDHGDQASRALLVKAIRRAGPRLRIEMIEEVARSTNFWTSYAPPVSYDWKLFARTILVAYLDDSTLRVLPDDDEYGDVIWGWDSSNFPEIEVRDFAAFLLAATFKQKPKSTDEWDKSDWEEFRKHVRSKHAAKVSATLRSE